MYLCRYNYLEYRTATTVQSVVRMFLCCSGYVALLQHHKEKELQHLLEEAQLHEDKECGELWLEEQAQQKSRMKAVRQGGYRLNRQRVGELLRPLEKRKYFIPFQQFLSHGTDERLIFDFTALKENIRSQNRNHGISPAEMPDNNHELIKKYLLQDYHACGFSC